MKKRYTLIATLFLGIIAVAQNNRSTLTPDFSNSHKVNPHIPTVVHRTPSTPHAVGDTVFVFDGYNVYDWNKSLPPAFNFKLEDLDTYTISTTLQPYFGVKGSFSFFYELNPTSNIVYDHKDTVFYAAATSYFNAPAGKANNWLEMGPIHVPPDGGTLKWRDNLPGDKYRDGYEILVNTKGLGSANFTNPPVFSVADNDTLTKGDTVTTPYYGFVQYSVNVSAYAGQNIYIAVHHNANDQFVLQVTDIILTEGHVSGINENNGIIAALENIPNPASDNTMITYSLKEAANVELSLYDVTGKKLRSFNQGRESSGNHQLKLDVSTLPSGIYFYTISSGEYRMTRKMSVIK